MSEISPLYNEIKLNLTIVSDTHFDVKRAKPRVPKTVLKNALEDSLGSTAPTDAFIVVGDTTSRGSSVNWRKARKCFLKNKSNLNVLLAIGNHDCWSNDKYDKAIGRYYKNFEIICGFVIDKPYFSRVINGYHLIFLGNDADSGCEASIGDEQFEWFCEEMKKGGESGKPIFVFCHQSLNQKHGLPRTWDRNEKPDRPLDEGGIGERSDEIETEMKKYKNVYYFSGHSHMGLAGEEKKKSENYSSIEQEDSLTLMNIPSLSNRNHHGESNDIGWGAQIEAYENKVVIRPRNYNNHEWNTSISMKDGKYYYENLL